MAGPIVGRVIATPDPPPTGIRNPIHDADGADGAGYAGALVAGVRTYGWAAQTIVRALGVDWLDSGWVDVSLRRPLFAGEEVTITMSPPAATGGGESSYSAWTLTCMAAGADGDRVVLDGHAGLGDAAWLADLDPPEPAVGQDPPEIRPTYDLDSIPVDPLRPLAAYVKAEAARRLVTQDLGLTDPDDLAPYVSDDTRRIHPFFVAGRMAPLTRHNFTYGPTIHVRSQIQHRGPALADREVTVGAKIVDSYDRNGHWYQVLDGIVTSANPQRGPEGASPQREPENEVAYIRHHTIFRPRGTTMPDPIRSAEVG